jgi:hypothetical protein
MRRHRADKTSACYRSQRPDDGAATDMGFGGLKIERRGENGQPKRRAKG